MKNKLFKIQFNANNGSVSSIVSSNDSHRMNWCIDDGGWGIPLYQNAALLNPLDSRQESVSPIPMVTFTESNDRCISCYQNDRLNVIVERYFSDNDYYNERYTIKNISDSDFFLEHGAFGITVPFNDIYTYTDDCLVNRCNTHIWCGGNTSYICALKMGESDINLGLVLTRGAIRSYSVKNPKTNHRGILVLNPEHFELLPGEEYVIQWQMFWHSGNEDFYNKAYEYPTFINVKAPQFTVFQNEQIVFDVLTKNAEDIKIICDGKCIDYKKTDTGCTVFFAPDRLGEYRFDISVGNTQTYAEFFVAEEIETLLRKRIRFIVDNQQYLRKESPLYGAFLIYDNKEKEQIFDSVVRDHNACRERTGMALLLTKYLQHHNDNNAKKALDNYIAFVLREVFDSNTGDVFDGIGKNVKYRRLYNAPWLSTLFTEMYLLTKDSRYLYYIIKILKHYYSVGGEKFYPNGLSMRKTVAAFYHAGMPEEGNVVKAWFIKHTNNIVSNALSYPEHEVNFEQTIVAPAVTFISEIACITDNKRYEAEAYKHIKVLERFNGHQPSFHLNEIPIRFWDDFWFGKERLFGDTFPHYWSCLTARAFTDYYYCSGNDTYKLAAKKCIRNCLCLFNNKGEGSCAYVYPYKINDIKGRFYDEWANDQDFALYFYLEIMQQCNVNLEELSWIREIGR